MRALTPAPTEASTDMSSALAAARAALDEGDAQRCLRLAEPWLPRAGERARGLMSQALAQLSERCVAAGDHAQALQHFRRYHQLVIDGLEERLARSPAPADDADRDPLTGLLDASALTLRLPTMMSQALNSQRGLCLVRMELDPLQPARLAGIPGLDDGVLREVGALLRSHSRAKDLALRYNGQTLVLVLSDVELATARMVCERIRRAVQGHDWAPLHEELRVSLSLGLTALRSGDSAKELMARAEAGLVSARRDGRNCVRTGVPGL